jgi:endoglucanase
MKKITFFLSLVFCSVSFSQIVTNGDFQTGTASPWYGNAANVVDLGVGVFVNQANITAVGPAYQVNLSQDISLNSGSTYLLTFDAFTDTVTNSRTMIVGFGQNAAPWTALIATSTLTSTPQTFSYQFTINYGDTVNDRVIFDMGAALGYVFIDNVSVVQVVNTCNNGIQDGNETGVDCGGSCPACLPSPTVAAPTQPNRPSADVISIFSDSYAPIATLNYSGVDGQPSNDNTFNTSWCPGVTTLVQVQGNNTNKVTGLGCEGVAFFAGRFNATGFTRFHIDIWTPTTTQDKVFSFKFSNWNNTTGETNAYEYTATNANTLPSGAQGTWITIDIPFSIPTFNCINTPPGNACPSISDFTQFVITSNLETVYYDNLYLHKNTVLSTNDFETSKARIYPNPATNLLNIESEISIEKVTVNNILGQEVISKTPNAELVTLDVSSLQVGVYIVKTSINGNVSSTRFIKE